MLRDIGIFILLMYDLVHIEVLKVTKCALTMYCKLDMPSTQNNNVLLKLNIRAI